MEKEKVLRNTTQKFNLTNHLYHGYFYLFIYNGLFHKMKFIFALLDLILPTSVILFSFFKVQNVSMKWYIINLLAAYCIGGVGRNMALAFEAFVVLEDDIITEIIDWFITYTRTISFALIRFISFFCILEIYSIYALKMRMLQVLYERRLRAHIFVHLCAQVVSVPVTILSFVDSDAVFAFIKTFYYLVAIYTAYNEKLLGQNARLTRALTPLIFYFLPITLVDLSIAVGAIALICNMDWDILGIILEINRFVLMV
uniref:Serpentine receptor class gamma n=1 Tax=Elaeophora elaphi TaxID=1147741 RepID=A0A0R3RMK3_9BILA